ncbi:hypothetical protein FHR83_005346 [Actinoplanes campanulatus]|uniref:Resolvase, N terminal domain n=1 Tax=Actinoplanes campanulatus TaxID=113559 RepID=A0A7W5FGN8_9ACTN|nr:hypothetical protein [Actinoplanes campanulatus]MBB3097662.1 hypothetical protein [Actinoplanes campanulatus]
MTSPVDATDLMSTWLSTTPTSSRVRGHPEAAPVGLLRFAFYGRMSTVEYQDDLSSRGWQRDSALHLIAGHGVIVSSYFDAGCFAQSAMVAAAAGGCPVGHGRRTGVAIRRDRGGRVRAGLFHPAVQGSVAGL